MNWANPYPGPENESKVDCILQSIYFLVILTSIAISRMLESLDL